MGIVVLCVC
jgi:hypothetical protein